MPTFILFLVLAYLAGSLNFSILLFRLTGREDPRQHGSGNPGATNVYRQAGAVWAAVVLLLDMGRAIVVAVLAQHLLNGWQVPWVGFCLIFGNRFPCFHGFKGGKGVANYLGFTLAILPIWAVLAVLTWGAAYLAWRTPFLSSFSLIAVLAIGWITSGEASPVHGAGVVTTILFIVACHHRNIREKWLA